MHKKMRSSKFSVREAIEIINWSKAVHLDSLLKDKIIDEVKARKLIDAAVKHVNAYFELHGNNVETDVNRCTDMLSILNKHIHKDIKIKILNENNCYDMSFLERICLCHDTISSRIVTHLINMGSNPLRPDALLNAVQRTILRKNKLTLVRMHENGLVIEGSDAQKVMSIASRCNVDILKILINLFNIDPHIEFEEGNNLLHKLAMSNDIRGILEKLEFLKSLNVLNKDNKQGINAIDMSAKWGSAELRTYMETYYNNQQMENENPLISASIKLLALNTTESKKLSDYLLECSKWGISGKLKTFEDTGYGVGAIAIELGDIDLLSMSLHMGDTVNARAPRGASLLGYAAVLFQENPALRDVYMKMFELLLDGSVDWNMYDKDGISVRTWVEHSLLSQKECYGEERVEKLLSLLYDKQIRMSLKKQLHQV